MTVLEITGLCADAGEHRLLHDVDLVLDRGEVLAVLGESGAGKSTLGLALLGESAPGVELSVSGDSRCRDYRRSRPSGSVALLPQHPGAVLDPVRRVGPVLRELAALRHRDRAGRATAIADACEAARFDPTLLRRFPHQLSGGQQQRAALAQTLVTGPDVVVLDEPTTGLDPATSAELVERLDVLRARGTALVLLTHDLDVARALGGRAMRLDHGRVVARGTVAELLGPAAPHEVPTGRLIGDVRLQVRGLAIADRTGRPVLHGVDLDARAGELLGVVGLSGAGKTTLGRCVAGLAPARGTVRVDGALLSARIGRRSRAQRRAVQYVHQDPRATFLAHRNVVDQVARPAVLLRNVPTAAARDEAHELLTRLGVAPEVAARRPGTLSGGQLQRAAVARALLAHPSVLVCDEVTSALDAAHRDHLLAAIDALRHDHDTTVLLICHDLPLVERVADRIVVVDDGRVRA
ncbi:ABC transporter ATP-binding protein [Pseudonocardia sulfidoxydans NBRC 16205]|uniref:ABC transporter ATP-binding protein n=1 Tax=Pseudonocardia sulfidoxydans NBRC 16205 TaxID=1223511 RepID=A0A511DJC5_9PSEU|nr:ATP-binding cassette domain-containing protein [Pseudonocardia sulfidoxydans]GEL24910.1 ABC transporter ATP-binding protein [Pseudonocardia sulfidoxydans NBRC 16205]